MPSFKVSVSQSSAPDDLHPTQVKNSNKASQTWPGESEGLTRIVDVEGAGSLRSEALLQTSRKRRSYSVFKTPENDGFRRLVKVSRPSIDEEDTLRSGVATHLEAAQVAQRRKPAYSYLLGHFETITLMCVVF